MLTNKQRWRELLDSTLSVFIAGILASGYVNVIGINGDKNPILHHWVIYFCSIGTLVILLIKDIIDPKEKEQDDSIKNSAVTLNIKNVDDQKEIGKMSCKELNKFLWNKVYNL